MSEYREIKIYASHGDMECLAGCLVIEGITGLVISDPEDIKEFAAEKSDSWDYIDEDLLKEAASGEPYVTVYIAEGEEGAADAEALRLALERATSLGIDFRVEQSSIREEDWANEWKKYFRPLKIGEKILIKPSWESVDPSDGRTVVELDPETSFGTGRHYTTQLCLELTEKYLNAGDTVLDLGCGSGIIFITALKLGASSAQATDISADAVKISAQNAEKNGISRDRFEVYLGDAAKDEDIRSKIRKGHKLVTANIVADVLICLSDVFAETVEPQGRLILSGIIDGREDEVLNIVKSKGFTVLEHRHADIWNAYALEKL